MIEWSEFSPKALDFIENSTSRLCILHGSVRSSKTINCTVRWLDYILTGPSGDLAMVGKTMATLQRNVLNDMFDIIGDNNYKWINRQQGELKVFHRRIHCFGANNEDAESKIRGATLAGAYCDEVSLYPQNVFNQLMARLSIKGAQCFCNTNPDNPFHWFYTDYITNDDISDKQVWKFLMDDNLSLDPDYVKSLKQMYTGVWYDRMIKGEWCAAEGRIYDMFDPNVHMVDTDKVIKEWLSKGISIGCIEWYVGCDYATSSVMSWGLFAINAITGEKLKVREYYFDAIEKEYQKTDSEFADEFVKWLNGTVPRVVYCDPSAASWKLELSRRGYNVQNAVNDVVNGIREVSSEIQSGRFLIDISCKYTKKEYLSYTWDPKEQSKGKDKPIKVRDHTCDSDRYVIHTYNQFGMAGVY